MDVLTTDASGSRQFSVMQSTFAKLMEQSPGEVHESFYTFGGLSAHFRIIGPHLAKHILRPFSHLCTDVSKSAVPELTIDLWDENLTGVRCQLGSPEGAGWTAVTATSEDGRFVGQQLPNTLTSLDRKTKHRVGSIAWSDRVFIYEHAKPLSRPLLEWHNDRGVQVIHANIGEQLIMRVQHYNVDILS